MGDGFEFKVQYMKQMYIAQLSEEEQQPFIEIVDQVLEIKQNDPQADTTTLEAEIDKMVFDLYNMSSEEINILKEI